MDFAHTETDKAIEELEKRLQAEYRQAYKETKAKLEKYLSDFARKDKAKRKLVDEGKLSQADYKKWRTNQMLTGQRWTKMVDVLARDMNRTNQIAADIINRQLSPTFALNANFAAYGIENGFRTDFGFTLYNEDTVNRLVAENPDLLPAPRVDIPEDIRWNKQKITSNITQAVLQGKSIPEIAKAMETVVGMNKASATRNARTAMTGAQNSGRQQAYDRAKAMGIKVKKEWIATLDGRTRHSHGMADGQRVEIDGKFKVGASELRYPGDPQGAAEEVYNCRCTMATVEPPEILQGEEPRMTYQEWVQTKEGQETLEKTRPERNKKAAKRRKAKNKQQNNAPSGLNSGGNGGIISINSGSINGYTFEAVDTKFVGSDKYKKQFRGLFDSEIFNSKIENYATKAIKYNDNKPSETLFAIPTSLNPLLKEKRIDKKHYWDEKYFKKGKEINLTKELMKLKHKFVVVHNHPNNTSLSLADLFALNDVENMESIISIGHNGKICSVKKKKCFSDKLEREFFERAYARNVSNYGYTNEAIKHFCEEVGWIYDI